MAAEITAINGRSNAANTKEFLLTSIDEVAKLPRNGINGTLEATDMTINNPCAYGSTALVCTGSVTEVYILTPDNQWTKM